MNSSGTRVHRREALTSAVKVAAATALFAGLHSLLAARASKKAAAKVAGARTRNALYRPFFNAQAVVTFAALLAFVRRQPERTLYRVERPWSLLLRAGQAAGLVHGLMAARAVGITELVGLDGLRGWMTGRGVPPGQEAQGPAPLDPESMDVRGPFRWHRHPLNFAPLPVLWLFPRMTTRLAGFAAASTMYFLLGSLHEEHRLRIAYGAAYERYRTSGVPFYLPRSTRQRQRLPRARDELP